MPKPKGYFRIGLPEHEYVIYDSILPFIFSYSNFADCKVEKKEKSLYWIDINYPSLNASLNLTSISLKNDLRELAIQEEKMINFHIEQGKTDDVEVSFINDDTNKVFGRLYVLKGKEVATTLQFWITDSIKYYVRGVLYFNFTPNNDSLQPVIQYLKEDVLVFINSLHWKKEKRTE